MLWFVVMHLFSTLLDLIRIGGVILDYYGKAASAQI